MATSPQIAAEILGENRSQRNDLYRTIASGEAIPFIGAGLSAPLGYPGWPALLGKLATEAGKLGPFTPRSAISDALAYAEEVLDHFISHQRPDLLNELVGREFRPREGKPFTPTHARLVRLPFRAFLTTNYDGCIEDALSDHWRRETSVSRSDCGVTIKRNHADRHMISCFLRSITNRTAVARRYVAHLHGKYDDTANIVLTASSYADAYGIEAVPSVAGSRQLATLHGKLAWSLFATRRMIFLGFSVDDPYIKILLNTVLRDLWEQTEAPHFVILPLDEQLLGSVQNIVSQFQNYGLQPVFFDNLKGDFSGLDQLLDEAFQYCSATSAPSSPPIEQFPIASPTVPEPARSTISTIAPEVDAHWLDRVSETTLLAFKNHED